VCESRQEGGFSKNKRGLRHYKRKKVYVILPMRSSSQRRSGHGEKSPHTGLLIRGEESPEKQKNKTWKAVNKRDIGNRGDDYKVKKLCRQKKVRGVHDLIYRPIVVRGELVGSSKDLSQAPTRLPCTWGMIGDRDECAF